MSKKKEERKGHNCTMSPGPVAQINCIRMEIVFCVLQQVLLERTNFLLGPNSFENVILCSLQYILTNPMHHFVHTIWSVSYIAQCPVWFWACQRLSEVVYWPVKPQTFLFWGAAASKASDGVIVLVFRRMHIRCHEWVWAVPVGYCK